MKLWSVPMVNKKLKRLPYRIDGLIFDSGFVLIEILPIDAPSIRGAVIPYPLGVPEDIAKFIHENCTCYSCNAPISEELSKCACNNPCISYISDFDFQLHLKARFPADLYYAIFRRMWRRETMRQKSAKRLKRLAENGGKHTTKDIKTLYELQMGICFYCGDELSVTGKNKYQIDHRLPIVDGGRDDIANLVLACPFCNNGKLNDYYDDSIILSRDREMKKKLRLIRKNRNEYLALHGLLPKGSSE
jgi:5-methylcytosine-specific restriction endonuclease McrA